MTNVAIPAVPNVKVEEIERLFDVQQKNQFKVARCSAKERIGKEPNCRQKDQQIWNQHRIPHHGLVTGILDPPWPVQGHVVWVDGLGHPSHQQTVVGRQGRVVQTPVLEVVVAGVVIPRAKQTNKQLLVFWVDTVSKKNH